MNTMNNYEYFAGPRPGAVSSLPKSYTGNLALRNMVIKLEKLYELREKIISDHKGKWDVKNYNPVGSFEWLFHEADDALVYSPGDLVKIVDSGEYAVVSDWACTVLQPYGYATIRSLIVTTAKENTRVYAEAVEKADIPKEIIDVARSQLRSQCPIFNKTVTANWESLK